MVSKVIVVLVLLIILWRFAPKLYVWAMKDGSNTTKKVKKEKSKIKD